MRKYKRRSVTSTCNEEDRISNLPEHVIDSILEWVPLEDAVRTSILSKKWRYTWTKMRALIFDEEYTKKFAKNGAFGHNGIIRIINQVLILHKGSILKFHLHIPDMALDSFHEVYQWMLILSRKGVTQLVLNNSKGRYKLPSHVFSCQELRKLKLERCFFKPPLEFEGFPNLETLILKYVVFGENLSGNQINLPQLKKLSLYGCTDVYNFNLKAANLQILGVIFCASATFFLRLLDTSCLNYLTTLTLVGVSLQKFTEDHERDERINLATVLSNLPRIAILTIDSHFIKFFITEKIPELLPHTLNSLKHLGLMNFQLSDSDQLHGALCLLRNSPNLERFGMLQLESIKERENEVGRVSNEMEAPNWLDFALNRLKIVEIGCIEGSKQELDLIKLLLAHSPSLETLAIRPSVNSDAQKRHNLSKSLMRFPRASPKAEVIYVDPQPHQDIACFSYLLVSLCLFSLP